jgi:sporulation and spore germination protein
MRARTGLVVTAAVTIALAGCGVPSEPTAREVEPPRGPYRAPTSGPPAAPEPGTVPETLYFIRDNTLVPVERQVRTEPTLDTLVRHLLAGPSDSERDSGLTSALLGADIIAGVHADDGEVVVELSAALEGTGRTDEILALAQVVCTLSAQPGYAACRSPATGAASECHELTGHCPTPRSPPPTMRACWPAGSQGCPDNQWAAPIHRHRTVAARAGLRRRLTGTFPGGGPGAPGDQDIDALGRPLVASVHARPLRTGRSRPDPPGRQPRYLPLIGLSSNHPYHPSGFGHLRTQQLLALCYLCIEAVRSQVSRTSGRGTEVVTASDWFDRRSAATLTR